MIGQVSRYVTVTRRERRWGFHVTSAGHAVARPGQAYPPATHPRGYDFNWERGRRLEEFALVYLVAGQGIFEADHRPASPVMAGQAWFLFPGEWHRYRPDPATGWEEYWMTFGGTEAERWRKEKFLAPRRCVVGGGLGLSLAPTFEELIRLLYAGKARASFATAGLGHLLVGRALAALEAEPVQGSVERRIREAADALRLQAQTAPDLPCLARRLGMSYGVFRRAFTRHIGLPPHRFHQQARLALVKEMLGETDFPLKKIAEQLAYPSEFYLMQSFKRQTGQTPTQWRKAKQGPRG
jgi:AraC-like DNA-binding protein